MKNFLKSIVVMVAVFASVEASAQNVLKLNNQVLTWEQPKYDADSIRMYRAAATEVINYLREHPTDSIKVYYGKTKNGIIGVRFFIADGKPKWNPIVGKTDTIQLPPIQVVDYEEAADLEKKIVDTRFEFEITNYGQRRDVVYFKILPDGKKMTTKLRNGESFLIDTIAIKKFANKDGFAVQAEGSYQLANGMNAFSGKIGISYTGRWWKIEVLGGPTRTIYSTNADHAGEKYWALGTEAGFYFQPFKLDKCDQWRLWLGGGVGWEWYRTDSQISADGTDLRSEGNCIFPHAGGKLEWRGFATGNSLYLGAKWRPKKLVIQNQGRESVNAVEFFIGIQGGLWRIYRGF